MAKTAAAFLSVALAVTAATAQDFPAIVGVVTRVTSQSDFEVSGQHIFCASSTKIIDPATPYGSYLGCPSGTVFLGEVMAVWGDWDKKRHVIATSQIELGSAPDHEVSGTGVIDAAPTSADLPPGTLMVRADGYRVRIDATTVTTWADPLYGLADVKAGNWIEFKGTRAADGSVIATSALFRPAAFSAAEMNDRGNYEYDPAAVPTKQGTLSQAFKGIDPMRFPPYKNGVMQERINDVGQQLIPAYQDALPDSDLAKINFRFQLVETNVWWDTTPLPSGIILVPHELVERMQNDSQLAAVLADGIASILEKQDFRTQSTARAILPEAITNAAASAKTAGAQIAGLSSAPRVDASTKAIEQSGRVALCLMHDAGFDISQAPIAWWLLSRKKVAPVEDMPLPPRAAYIYQVLGQNWMSQDAAKR